MALTDHEQHQLLRLAEQLLKDDPRLAAKLTTGSAADPHSGGIGGGAFTLLVGLFVFAAGIGAHALPLGLLGFALAVAGAYRFSQRFRLRAKRPADSRDAA